MPIEALAFAGFGVVCLAVYWSAKALDDRDRARSDRQATLTSSADQTISFVTNERSMRAGDRVTDRPAERESRPSDRPQDEAPRRDA